MKVNKQVPLMYLATFLGGDSLSCHEFMTRCVKKQSNVPHESNRNIKSLLNEVLHFSLRTSHTKSGIYIRINVISKDL